MLFSSFWRLVGMDIALAVRVKVICGAASLGIAEGLKT